MGSKWNKATQLNNFILYVMNHEAYTVNVVASFLSSYKDHLEPAIANLRKLLQSLKVYIVIASYFIILPLYIKSVLIRIMKHW
ncbi:hypothetical protein HanPI659440_Chr16g0619391 [Helianthus annuus]|nr:hypothetical protein HanPI659440_Chr16g0619391 [Helianthus annuus]